MPTKRNTMAWMVLLLTCVFIAGPFQSAAFAADNPALGIGEPNTNPCGNKQCCNDPNCCKKPPCCKQPPCDCKGSGSPVNFKFGTATFPFVDLEYRIGDIEYVIRRNFISDDPYVGSFGKHVTSTLDQMSISTRNGDVDQELVIVRTAEGKRYQYQKQPDNSYSGPTGHYDVLALSDGNFEVINEDGDMWTFDAVTGWLLSREDRYGHTVSYTYNGNGQPTNIEILPGMVININYGPNGFVESIDDFAGREVQYEYDTSGNLTQFTDAAENPWTYAYDDEGLLTSVVNPLGQTSLAVTYDTKGKVLTMVDSDGDVTYGYGNGSTTRRDNALSRLHETNVVSTYYYDSEGVVTQIYHADGTRQYYNYDSLFSLTATTDPDSYVETYHYDSEGRVTQIDYPDGTNKQYTWHPTLDVKTSVTNERGYQSTWEYDLLGNVTREVMGVGTPGELTTLWEYDSLGRMTRSIEPGNLVTTIGYDSFGRMTQRVVPGPVTHTFEYDMLGNTTRAVDSGGIEILYEYDDLSRATQVTDGAGNVSTRIYDAAGRVAYEDDAIKGVHSFEYDGLGNLTRDVDGRSAATIWDYDTMYLTKVTDGLSREIDYEYSVIGALTKITRRSDLGDRVTDRGTDAIGRQTSVGGASGITETRTYDNRRRLGSLTRSDGLTQTFLYDATGNLTQTTDFWGNTTVRGYDELNRLTSEADDYGVRGEYYRDTAGRVTQVALPRGTRFYEFDTAGNMTRFVDADGNASIYEYDALGRHTALTRPGGERTHVVLNGAGLPTTATRGSNRATGFGYDGYLPSTYTEVDGKVTTFEYDDTFSITKMTLPDTTEYGFGYDAGGRVTSRTLPNGESIIAEYDDFNRRNKLVYPDLTETTVVYNNFDRISSITRTGAGTATFEYDTLGRVTAQTYDGRTVGYAYSADYKTVTITYPSGLEVVRQLDTLMRTSSITIAGDASPAVSYTYTADGVPDAATFGSGMTANYTFSGEKYVLGVDYADSMDGRIRGWARGINDIGSTAYIERLDDATLSSQIIRDDENRVTGKLVGTLDGSHTVPAPTRSESWTLDGLGNWDAYTLDGTTETRVHDLNNKLTQRDAGTPVTLVYNDLGALADDGNQLYTSNYDGMITEVRRKSDNTLIESYEYDAMSRLARITTEAGDEIEFVRDLEDRLLEVYVNDVLYSSHVHGGQYDEQVCAIIGGTRYYYVTDIGQNIAAMTDETGSVVESYEYDAYGRPRFFDGTGTPLTESAIGNSSLFGGRFYRPAVGLYYYRARYMSPDLGRFITPDPMGLNTGYSPNLYEYADSSPIDQGDPYGLCTGCQSTQLGGELSQGFKNLSSAIPWSVSVKLEGSGSTKICRKCCKGGSCGVTSSGTLQYGGGGSATFDVTPPIGGPAWMLFKGVWDAVGGKIGLYVTVSGSYTSSKEWEYDSCTGKTSSKSCAETKVSATAQGGASTPKIGKCKAEAWLYGGASYTYQCCTSSGSGGSSTKCESCVSGKVGFKGKLSCDLVSWWKTGISLESGFDIVIWKPKKKHCW